MKQWIPPTERHKIPELYIKPKHVRRPKLDYFHRGKKRGLEERLLARIEAGKGLGIEIRFRYLDDQGWWRGIKDKGMKIKGIPSQGDFWKLIEGMKEEGIRMAKEMRK